MKPQWYIKIKWGILDYIDLKKNAFGRRFNRFLEHNGRPGRIELGPALLNCTVFQQLTATMQLLQEKVSNMSDVRAISALQDQYLSLEARISDIEIALADYDKNIQDAVEALQKVTSELENVTAAYRLPVATYSNKHDTTP